MVEKNVPVKIEEKLKIKLPKITPIIPEAMIMAKSNSRGSVSPYCAAIYSCSIPRSRYNDSRTNNTTVFQKKSTEFKKSNRKWA